MSGSNFYGDALFSCVKNWNRRPARRLCGSRLLIAGIDFPLRLLVGVFPGGISATDPGRALL